VGILERSIAKTEAVQMLRFAQHDKRGAGERYKGKAPHENQRYADHAKIRRSCGTWSTTLLSQAEVPWLKTTTPSLQGWGSLQKGRAVFRREDR
jgi:hypothetical protein